MTKNGISPNRSHNGKNGSAFLGEKRKIVSLTHQKFLNKIANKEHNMKYDKIKEIKIKNGEKEINHLLKEGFQIKKILQSKDNNDSLQPCFILAKE